MNDRATSPAISKHDCLQLKSRISFIAERFHYRQAMIGRIYNYLRFTLNVHSITEIRTDQLQTAWDIVNAFEEASTEYLLARADFEEQWVINLTDNIRYTQVIKRKFKQIFGSLPTQLNWHAMAKAVMV